MQQILDFSIIDETTVKLPKSICSFMKDNRDISLEIIKLIENMIQEKSTIKLKLRPCSTSTSL